MEGGGVEVRTLMVAFAHSVGGWSPFSSSARSSIRLNTVLFLEFIRDLCG